MSALDIIKSISSAPGVPGGGASVPQLTIASKAESSLNSSGSTYNLGGGTPGDLIVGGQKDNSWVMIAVAAGLLLLVLRR